MRIITLFIVLTIIACNNSSEKKTDIKDTVNTTTRMPATAIIPDTIFTGFGTEPFWSVYVIKDSKIIFHPADGDDVEVPFVEATSTEFGMRYKSSSPGASIDLDIAKKECSDGMSEEMHTHRVILKVNKTEYTGCGRDGK